MIGAKTKAPSPDSGQAIPANPTRASGYLRLLTAQLLRRRIVRDGAWVVVGQIASTIGSLLAFRILTEFLTPSAFGYFALLLGVEALLLGLAANPLLQAVVHFYPENRNNVRQLRTTAAAVLSKNVALFAAGFLVAWLLLSLFIDLSPLAGGIVVCLLAIDVAKTLELVLFSASRRQASAAALFTADAILRPAVAFILLGGTVASGEVALAGYALGSLAALLAIRAIGQPEGLGATERGAISKASNELAATLKRYALPLRPLAIFGWIIGQGDRYLVASIAGLFNAGLYAAAYGLVSRPFLMLANIVELTMRPVLQDAVAARDRSRIGNAQFHWVAVTMAIGLGGVALVFALAKPISSVLLAEEYRATATMLLPILATGLLLQALSNAFIRFCYAFNKTTYVLIISGGGALCAVGVLVPATIVFGIVGAAVAASFYFGAQLALAIFLANRAKQQAFATASHPAS